MVGNKIETQGLTFFYDINFEYGGLNDFDFFDGHDPLNTIPKEKLSLFCRPVLFANPFYQSRVSTSKWQIAFLYFYDDTSLKNIDEKVITGTYTDLDFKSIIFTSYKLVWCGKCAKKVAPALFCIYDITYPKPMFIEKNRTEIYEKGLMLNHCIICDDRVSLGVVHWFDKSYK